MELKKAPQDAGMPKKNSRKAVFACAAVFVAGLMGCASSSPPKRTTTICDSFGVPPRDRAREEMPAKPYSEAEAALLQPPYSYIDCVTVEER